MDVKRLHWQQSLKRYRPCCIVNVALHAKLSWTQMDSNALLLRVQPVRRNQKFVDFALQFRKCSVLKVPDVDEQQRPTLTEREREKNKYQANQTRTITILAAIGYLFVGLACIRLKWLNVAIISFK